MVSLARFICCCISWYDPMASFCWVTHSISWLSFSAYIHLFIHIRLIKLTKRNFEVTCQHKSIRMFAKHIRTTELLLSASEDHGCDWTLKSGGIGRVVRQDSEASQILAILMTWPNWGWGMPCASYCYANGCDIHNTLKLKMHYSTQIIFYVIHIHSGQYVNSIQKSSSVLTAALPVNDQSENTKWHIGYPVSAHRVMPTHQN